MSSKGIVVSVICRNRLLVSEQAAIPVFCRWVLLSKADVILRSLASNASSKPRRAEKGINDGGKGLGYTLHHLAAANQGGAAHLWAPPVRTILAHIMQHWKQSNIENKKHFLLLSLFQISVTSHFHISGVVISADTGRHLFPR